MSTNAPCLLAEEGVKNFRGHWTPYTVCIAKGLAEAGRKVVVAGHRDAEPDVRAAMPFESVFRFSRWDGLYEHRPWLERKALVMLHNQRLHRDMSSFLNRAGPFDLVFCGNVLVYHSLAWYCLAKRHLGKRFQRLVLMLIHPAGTWDSVCGRYQFPLRSKLFAWALRQTVDLGEKVTLAVETPAAQQEFAQLTGRSVHLLHHPVEAPVGWRSAESASRSGGKVRLSCPGFARYEKGSDVLLAALNRMAQRGFPEGVEAHLQWRRETSFATPEGHTIERDEHLRERGYVCYLEEPLGGEAYWNFLASADILVLPYRCHPYTTRLSRVAIEAMIVGRPIIYPAGSWLAYAVERSGVGLPFEDGSPESLAETILRALHEREALAEAARQRAAAVAAEYSAKRFAEALLALGNPTAS